MITETPAGRLFLLGPFGPLSLLATFRKSGEKGRAVVSAGTGAL